MGKNDQWLADFESLLKKSGFSVSCDEEDDTATVYARIGVPHGKRILLYLHLKEREISFAADGKVLLEWRNHTSKKTKKQTEAAFKRTLKKAKELMKKAHRPRLYAWGKESYGDHTRWQILLYDAPDNVHEWAVDQSIVIGIYHRSWKMTTPKAAVQVVKELLPFRTQVKDKPKTYQVTVERQLTVTGTVDVTARNAAAAEEKVGEMIRDFSRAELTHPDLPNVVAVKAEGAVFFKIKEKDDGC